MFRIDVSDFNREMRAALNDELARITAVEKEAMKFAADTTKEDLRREVRGAGLTEKIARTIRSRVYNDNGDRAAFIYTRAPEIIHSFATGATIYPVRGNRYLWLPTKSVPRKRGQGRATSTKRMGPQEVEREFRQPLTIMKGRGGNLLAFIAKDRGQTKTGKLRKVRKGRNGFGETRELVLMFTLVPSIARPRRVNLDAVAARGARRVRDFIERG